MRCAEYIAHGFEHNIYIAMFAFLIPFFAPYLDEIHGGVFQGDVYIGSTIINQVDPTQAGKISILVIKLNG